MKIVKGEGVTGIELQELLPPHIRGGIVNDPERGCWLWSKSKDSDGYGWASLNDKTYQVHRLVWRLLRGEPTRGLVIDHLCRVRHCVNPEHMELVTSAENLRRGNTPSGWKCCQKCGGVFTQLKRQRRCIPCHNAYEIGRGNRSRSRP
jgi:hypothetical protein